LFNYLIYRFTVVAQVSTELNFFGILLREGTKGVVVKRVLPTVKCCQFSSREINAVEVGDILFAVNNVEVVGFSLKEGIFISTFIVFIYTIIVYFKTCFYSPVCDCRA
jgi:hypothetical protein